MSTRERSKETTKPSDGVISAKDAGWDRPARVVLAFELAWLLFTVLNLKDWFLSAVDFYPYREAEISTFGLLIATWMALGRYGRHSRVLYGFGASAAIVLTAYCLSTVRSAGDIVTASVVILGTIALTGLVWRSKSTSIRRAAAILITGQSGVLLIYFLQDACRLPWTNNTLLGTGLGSRTISTAFISSETQITPSSIIVGHTSLNGIVAEQGLLVVVALASVIVVTNLAAILVLTSKAEADSHGLVACGLSTIDGLLFLACRGGDTFLTLNSAWGTCALFLGIGCVGAGLKRVTDGSGNVESPSKSTHLPATDGMPPDGARKRKTAAATMRYRLGATIAGILIVGAAGDRAVRTRIMPLAGNGAPYRMRAVAIQPDFIRLSDTAQVMQDATIAMEDHNFYRHRGLDWEALHRALRFDLRLGDVKQGGSTITQQLAKNVFLNNNDRSPWRKLEDMALAVEIERVLSKRRILELYLNTVDYGMGQHGVGRAARYYFHKTPAQLSLPESAILVGIAPDPMHERIDRQRLTRGEQTAIGRIGVFFRTRYSQSDIQAARAVPFDHLVYPDKDAWDRGATEEIPATWHNVAFYFLTEPDAPTPIYRVSASLKDRMAGVLDEANRRYHVVGIDHLGVYNDRPMRQSQTALSAHAFGQAIDVSGFRFIDGTHVNVADHARPEIAKRLAPLEALLKRHFDIVVDWRTDPVRHQTHFHCEVKGPRSAQRKAP